MSKYTYQGNLRGQLVTVDKDNTSRVYGSPTTKGLTAEFIDGPANVGTATGAVYTEGTRIFYEIIRVSGYTLYGAFPGVTNIYMDADTVVIKPNPAYDKAKDADAPNEDGSTTNRTPASSTGIANKDADSDDGDVSTAPGKDRVPVSTEDGNTVYVKSTPKAAATEGTDSPNKWLTYGLYGILGLGAITLIVVLVLSLSKPKVKPTTK